MMVVPVFMMSCQVRVVKDRPVAAQIKTDARQRAKAYGLPVV